MSEFNLIDEPWIPVRFLDGQRRELGIQETLIRSREIAAIEDPSPLIQAGLHRLLLAVLYRALEGPTDIDQAKALFRSGIPDDKVADYLARWHARFWLFDADAPFWQVPDYAPKEWRAWTALAAEHNADNAKVLFDHVSVGSPGSVPNAAAARWLIAVQTFAVSSGKSELAHTSNAPSATAVMVLPLGVNLAETLLLALLPQNAMVMFEDRAIWERPVDSLASLRRGPERSAAGIADLYTWRSRTIRLLEGEDGRVTVLAFASGVAYEPSVLGDPMVPYRMDEKLGRMPMQLRDRGIWRDFDSLLPDGADLAPAVMGHASRLTQRNPERRPRAVLAIGQATNKAKIEFWRAERFALPDDAAGGTARIQLRHLLLDADETQRALWAACGSYARDLIGRGTRIPAKTDVSAFVKQMAVVPQYWTMLEPRFHEILRGFTAEREFDNLRAEWLSGLRDGIDRAWRAHAAAVPFGDAWAIRALVRAEGSVAREIVKLTSEIVELVGKENAA